MSIPHDFPARCVSCGGDGKCAERNGTGTNTHLNEAEPRCKECSGMGVCPKCNGTGKAYLRPPELLDLGLNKL